ncbi:DUF6177 family protein [Actinomadura viridis]|uniref:DUF6177 family protein n=1 Tax=Actinomadura viridis TaxID=58110 RepID=UPI0036A7F62A
MTAADVRTDRTTVLLTDRAIVPLSPGMTDSVQVVTPVSARVTLPMRAHILSGRATWVVRDDGGYYDGLTGRPLHWSDGAFVPVPSARDYAPGFKTSPSQPLGSHLTLAIRAKHTEAGSSLDQAMRLLTGAPPTGWGTSEPLEHRWNPAALTAYVRSPSFTGRPIIAIGQRSLAITELTRESDGIVAVTTLTIGYAPGETPPLQQLPALIASLEHTASVLAHQSLGRPDLTTEPRWTGKPTPIGLAVRGNHPTPQGHPIGPMTWFPLRDWPHYHQTLHHLSHP